MGYHHVNCRSALYWIMHLYRVGFKIDFHLTKEARRIAGHGYFKNGGLVFIKQRNTARLIPVSFYISALWHQCVWYMEYIGNFYKAQGFTETIKKLYARLLRISFLCCQK